MTKIERKNVPYSPLIFFFWFLSFAPLYGQNAWNMELLWEYNRGDERYSGSWCYAAPDGQEYALLGAKTGTAIYRLEEPFSEVGFIPGPVSNWREITVVGHQAYVVTEGTGMGQGMQVIDLTPLPGSPTLLTTYSATFTRGHIIQRDIYSESPRVYVCGTTSTEGVHILDVSNPAQPVEIGVYQPGYYIHDCHVRGDRLYGAANNQQTLDIVDISDPANPELITTLPDPGLNTHSCSTTPDENYLFLADEADGQPGRIFDISNLDNIHQVAMYTANSASLVHNPYILGDLAILSHKTEGVRVLDIADPELQVEVGYFDTFEGLSGGFMGLWSACPYLPSGRIIGGDRVRGLFVWEFNGPRAARIYGSVRDSISGLPLPQALALINPLNDTLELDLQGKFGKGLLPGAYILAVYADGYSPKFITLSLEEQENLTLDVLLAPDNTSGQVDFPGEMPASCLVSPTVFSDFIRIQCLEPSGEWNVSFSDINGIEIFSKKMIGGENFDIASNNWKSGTYYCIFDKIGENRKLVFKVIRINP
ncbi:MAG: choice-of-anchor B family protein [Saprospirales bacterium]|nr:choice-of-anchor B family protein [Saprospirales bacterium]